MNLKFVFNELN